MTATPPLHGKTAVVTGSSAGLGLAVAEGLAGAGANVVLHGLEPDGPMEKVRRDLEERHGTLAAYVRSDLSSAEGVRSLFEAASAATGAVDIVVNNAVVRHFAPIERFPVAQWEKALAVNLSAAFHMVRLSLPGMRERGWGRIVNMTSVYAERGTRDRVDYVTTKSALVGFTHAVAAETLRDGITCNAVCPGSVLTPGTDERVRRIESEGVPREEAERRFLAGKQPSARFIRPEDVAAAVVFLCGPAARDITGTVLPVDGGWLAT